MQGGENREKEEEEKKHKKLNVTLRNIFLKTALSVICFKVATYPLDYSYENHFFNEHLYAGSGLFIFHN